MNNYTVNNESPFNREYLRTARPQERLPQHQRAQSTGSNSMDEEVFILSEIDHDAPKARSAKHPDKLLELNFDHLLYKKDVQGPEPEIVASREVEG